MGVLSGFGQDYHHASREFPDNKVAAPASVNVDKKSRLSICIVKFSNV